MKALKLYIQRRKKVLKLLLAITGLLTLIGLQGLLNVYVIHQFELKMTAAVVWGIVYFAYARTILNDAINKFRGL